MKGMTIVSIEELVRTKFGDEKWENTLEKAGLSKNTTFLMTEDVPDETFQKIVDSLCKTLSISLEQFIDMYGEYSVCTFGPRVYGRIYKEANNAKELILAMDRVHQEITSMIRGARPPRFTYEWKDERTLIIGYKSDRKMIAFLPALIKAVGKYYKEDLEARILSEDKAEVVFKK